MSTDLTALEILLHVSLKATAKKAVDLAIPEAALNMAKTLQLAFGSGLGKSDQIWWDRRVIAGGGNDPLDLAGTLTSKLTGGAVTFMTVCGLVFFNRSDETLTHSGGSHTATDAAIVVGDTSSTFTGPWKTVAKGQIIVAGGMFVATNPLSAGWAVTPDSADILQVDNEDGSDEALYDVAIWGDSG